MPKPFNPARAAAAARGMRVIEGESSAARRAAALQRSASKRTQPEFTDVSTGKTYRGLAPQTEAEAAALAAQQDRRGRPIRYSSRATAAQQARMEALERHAQGAMEDPRTWGDEPASRSAKGKAARLQTEAALRGPEEMLRRFEQVYGYRPARGWTDVAGTLSPQALEDLLNLTLEN